MGDFTLHQCFLQFNARCGDGYGQVLPVSNAVVVFGYNGWNQIRKSFACSDLRFTESNLLFGKTDIHLLCKSNLFFPNVISVIGENNTED